MHGKMYAYLRGNWTIVSNSASLVATTVATSGLGFGYWLLAARHFPVAEVGFASAAISAMLLLGSLTTSGLGTALIGQLQRQIGTEDSLIIMALMLAGSVGGGLGVLFATTAPLATSEFEPLRGSLANTAVFALGVGLTATAFTLDQALIGLLRGELQLGRNVLFAAAKLCALLVIGAWLGYRQGLGIYITWAVGNLVSLVGLAFFAVCRRGTRIGHVHQWRLLPGLALAALEHYGLNLALQAPRLAMPLVVTVLLSATMNAYFYTAAMVAGFASIGPAALATVLYAVGAGVPVQLAPKLRFTLALSVLAGLLANTFLLFGAGTVLGIFGPEYAEQAEWSLRILGLGVFPLIVKEHYVAVSRVHGKAASAALLMAPCALLELALAALGASLGGLSGLSLGWVAAWCIEAALMARAVCRVADDAGSPADHEATDGTRLSLAVITPAHGSRR